MKLNTSPGARSAALSVLILALILGVWHLATSSGAAPSTPKATTPTRASRTFADSEMPGRSGTTMLCDTSDADTRSAESTVDRIADTSAPAKKT